MRYMMFIKHREDFDISKVPQSLFGAMDKFIAESAKEGVFVDGAGLQPSKAGHKVRLAKGKITTTDGPFTETKELIAGYCLIDVTSWDEAMEWATRFAKVERNGETELRPLYEASDFPPEIFAPEDAQREQDLRDELQRKAAKR